MSQETKVLVHAKGSERYVFVYDDANRAETLRVFGRFAENSELSFTWYDAALLSQRIRHEGRKLTASQRFRLSKSGDRTRLG